MRRRAGRVYSILKNWPERRVKAICLTDGERVGALGDLGVQAVGVPISKLALYSACAGIPPTLCLPVCIDAGARLLSCPAATPGLRMHAASGFRSCKKGESLLLCSRLDSAGCMLESPGHAARRQLFWREQKWPEGVGSLLLCLFRHGQRGAAGQPVLRGLAPRARARRSLLRAAGRVHHLRAAPVCFGSMYAAQC